MYNRFAIPKKSSKEGLDVTTADTLRALLLIAIVSMAVLSFVYLSRRRLGWRDYLLLGLFSALVPVFGPFLVIALRPGSPRLAGGE
jgi:hypothetical protein